MSGTRSALIIANDRYDDPGLRRLRAPGQDAKALARVLGDPAVGGFRVRTVTNEPEHRLRREIVNFFANRARDDLLLAHFSCHGVKDDNGELYFATVDTEVGNLDGTAVPAEFVNRQMNRSKSRRVVLLLDCCYSGAFARGLMARATSAVDLKERFEGRGRIVLTASSSMEYAFEDAELSGGRGRPSVFTRALVQGLETGAADRDGDGYVSVDELYDHIYDEVCRTSPKQTPGRWDFEVQGDLLIARTPRPRPVPLPAELRQALEHPFAEVRLAAIEELKRLLGGSHAGFALAAEAALQDLTQDDSQRVSSEAAAALGAYGEGVATREPVRPARRPGISGQPRPPEHSGRSQEPTVPSRAIPVKPARPRPMPQGLPIGPRPVVEAVASNPGRTELPAKPATSSGRPAPTRQPWRRMLALAVPVLLLAGLFGTLRLVGGSQEVTAGQWFQAVSPWRLQVDGRDCAASVSSSDGGVTSAGHGTNFALQIRASGKFMLRELTSGCTASVATGPGSPARLPFTLAPYGDGTGGDSRPFHSDGSFRVSISGSACQTRIHRASDGSLVDELPGTNTWEFTPGDFYIHSDQRCTTMVTPV